MISKDLLGCVSIACSMVGYSSYVMSILRGKTKPHMLSWCVWTLVMGIVFFAQFTGGAGAGSWATGVSATCCLIITLLSLARGEKNITRSDWIAFLMALAIIPIWHMTKNPLIAVVLATLIDAGAYYATYRKSWAKPHEESFWLYFVDCMKWVIAFFAFDHYSLVILIYPSFLFISDMVLVFMIIGRRLYLRPAKVAKAAAIIALMVTMACGASRAHAQTQMPDKAIYMVTDVAVDVTADSAAHARDQAITEAQRTAFGTLLERLSASADMAAKLKPDDLAALVQNFEVQSEHTSSVRYIGIYTVQFRPTAVRKYLSSRGVSINETRSKPVLILPIYVNGGHPLLWEETTRWRTAWDKAPHDDGLVPVVLPAGGLDDIALLSTEEAVSGNAESIQKLADKYQVDTVVAAVFAGDVAHPESGSIDITRYDTNGASPPEHIDFDTTPHIQIGGDVLLATGVHNVRHQLEKDWQASMKQGAVVATPSSDGGSPSISEALPDTPLLHVLVTAHVTTLAEWADMKRILGGTEGVARVNVISVGRGEVSAELEISKTLQELQTALMQQHVQLSQDLLTQAWGLRRLP